MHPLALAVPLISRRLECQRERPILLGGERRLLLSVGEPLYTANWIVLHIVAQSMARELGPRGIHVAHVIVDGQVRSDRYEHLIGERGPDSLIEPEAAVEAYWQLSRQPRSAWSFEVDLRPWVERF